MAMVSPAIDAFLESLSTLKFANRAKNIKNRAHINEDLDEKALLRLVYSLSHTYSTHLQHTLMTPPRQSKHLIHLQHTLQHTLTTPPRQSKHLIPLTMSSLLLFSPSVDSKVGGDGQVCPFPYEVRVFVNGLITGRRR